MDLAQTDDKRYVYDQQSGSLIHIDEAEWIRFKAERNRILETESMKERLDMLTIQVAELTRIIQEMRNV